MNKLECKLNVVSSASNASPITALASSAHRFQLQLQQVCAPRTSNCFIQVKQIRLRLQDYITGINIKMFHSTIAILQSNTKT